MFSRSAISPGPVGVQPSFSRVCALEAHGSIRANDRASRNAPSLPQGSAGDRHVQTPANGGGDVFQRYTIFGDCVIPVSSGSLGADARMRKGREQELIAKQEKSPFAISREGGIGTEARVKPTWRRRSDRYLLTGPWQVPTPVSLK